jgi:hypothetical protein
VALVLAVLVLAVYAKIVVVPSVLHPDTGGFAAYYTAARVLLRQTRDLSRLYDDAWFQSHIDAFGFVHVRDIYYVQPPTMALLLAPVAWLSPSAARATWITLCVGFWLSGSSILYRAISRRAASISSFLFLGAATAVYRPLRENFDPGQGYVLLFFLLTLHLWLLLKGDRRAAWAAGIPLGWMLILKLAGIWIWLLLLLSRRWRAAAAAAIICLTIALLCLPAVGMDSWRSFFHELPRLAYDPMRHVSAYQTVAGLFGHLFVLDPHWNQHPIAHCPAVAMLSTILVSTAVLLKSVQWRRLDDSHEAMALSLGMFDSLIVSLSPVAEGYHYMLVLPAVMIAVWHALNARIGRGAWTALIVSIMLLTAPQRLYGAPAIQAGWFALLAYPRVYGAFVLWGWFGLALTKCHPASRSS